MSFQTLTKAASPLGALEGISSPHSPGKPLLLRQILKRPVILSIMNLLFLEFQTTCYGAIVPVMLAMPVPLGGLGFTPAQIGYFLGACRASAAFFMAFYFSSVVHYLGERRTYIIGASCSVGVWIFLPGLNFCAWRFGISPSVSTAIVALTLPTVGMDMAYGTCIPFLR